jgi:hypothetical protein
VQHPSFPSTGLIGTQISTVKIAGLNDPEEAGKYNNAEVKFEASLITSFNVNPAKTKIY